MKVIYEPKGKAREYSPYACNIYMGCNHGCKYCYAPAINKKTRDLYKEPYPRKNILKDFETSCKNKHNNGQQVQLSFMTDPYNSLESKLRLTRKCLETAYEYKIPISILTKSASVIKDIDIIKKFGKNITVGMTLTFDNKEDSFIWEPEAATPRERLGVLEELKKNNVTTWASFEPVIKPEQSLDMMFRSVPYVDIYKVGKLNNYKGLDKAIDWNAFLKTAINILRNEGKRMYIKQDLRSAAGEIELDISECSMDYYNLGQWK